MNVILKFPMGEKPKTDPEIEIISLLLDNYKEEKGLTIYECASKSDVKEILDRVERGIYKLDGTYNPKKL